MHANANRLLLVSSVVLLLSACGPVWRVSGGRLFGEVVIEPVADWSYTDEIVTIAVEVRPNFPHSVTTWCFEHGGELYVPAGRPSEKMWPELVRQNPSVRLEIAGKVYPGRLVQVTDDGEMRALLAPLAAKYQLGALDPQADDLPDLALFRFDHANL